jgi:hypothetical protein
MRAKQKINLSVLCTSVHFSGTHSHAKMVDTFLVPELLAHKLSLGERLPPLVLGARLVEEAVEQPHRQLLACLFEVGSECVCMTFTTHK